MTRLPGGMVNHVSILPKSFIHNSLIRGMIDNARVIKGIVFYSLLLSHADI
jgi:hypothetical protein